MTNLRGSPESQGRPSIQSPYRVLVPGRFIVLTIVASFLCAFAVGRTAHYILVDLQPPSSLSDKDQNKATPRSQFPTILPTPVLPGGKRVPQTSYTSKNFDTARSSRVDSRWVLAEEATCDSEGIPTSSQKSSTLQDDDDDTEEEDHAPSGQHLLLDFQFIDGEFLNSEVRLAHAMIQLVQECGLTLLSYHCHKLDPAGVSCAGVLLESHVAFHTWPEHGVISLDLFTCGPNSLLPVIPIAQKLFSVPGSKDRQPQMRWVHNLRGFQDEDQDQVEISALGDMFLFPVGAMIDYKEKIASVQTDFQMIDIYDVLTPQRGTPESYEKSLASNGSYESTHPELFQPDRIIFLGGMLQSRRIGDAAYHEALVHPTLFAHPNPKRVAIIGGGEGATLREVLKHNTIEKVVMIEIDEMMVNVSRRFLPEWSDCSNLVGRSDNCFDDARVELYFEDAFKWFEDRFLSADEAPEDPFDVIIMDALDPQALVEIAGALYTDRNFYESLSNGLSPDGILISQVGEAVRIQTPSDEHSLNRHLAGFIHGLMDIGFGGIRGYQEAGCGFMAEWSFIAAFKNRDIEANWFATEALLNLKISKRISPTLNDESPLQYFDGATMQRYRFPSKPSEVVYCRRNPVPESCKDGHGFDPERMNIPVLGNSEEDESAGAKANADDILQLSYVGLEKRIHTVQIEPWVQSVIRSMEEHWSDGKWNSGVLGLYNHGYGRSDGRENIYNPVADRQVRFDHSKSSRDTWDTLQNREASGLPSTVSVK